MKIYKTSKWIKITFGRLGGKDGTVWTFTPPDDLECDNYGGGFGTSLKEVKEVLKAVEKNYHQTDQLKKVIKRNKQTLRHKLTNALSD